jgi:hypothetical protein
MTKVTTIVGLAMLAAAGAWGADVVAEGSAYTARAVAAREVDGQRELSWDNGTRRWNLAWYTGAGSWVGNDFDLSTISAYRAVEKVKFYSRDNWPNSQWDGFRVGIYAFTSVPGSLIWPTAGGGYFFKPSGLQGHVWVEINIGWTCPSMAFVAAVEQYYNYPDCDPLAMDSNPTFRGHSWQRYEGRWSPAKFPEPCDTRNVMLRVIVDNSTLGVTAASLGRVKALYY